MSVLRARDNPRVRRWARLVADARFRRSEGRIVVEGPHLIGAALERGWRLRDVLACEAALLDEELRGLVAKGGRSPVLVSEAVLKSIVESDTPQGIAAELELAETPASDGSGTVFLEGIQDAGNVGAILRSAGAFGVGNAVLDSGCADAWSAKTLRAGAGAHFLLHIRQVARLGAALDAFKGRLLCTVPRGGIALVEADLSGALGWVFGSEGKGVSEAVQARAALRVRIPTLASTESLNVAAAAAICFYASFGRRPGFSGRPSTPGAGS
jgi:TrmH family RNA methyltransferase